MKQWNKETGGLGEDIASDYLMKKGYLILERNFRNKFGEIDIIANDHDVLVFIEVKAKVGEDFGLPEEMVGKGKLFRIRHMATLYTSGEEVACRIDVVAIVLDEQKNIQRISHYENVY